MNILVKLPNKLGDTIISTVFINALHKLYPDSRIDIIIKKEIAELVHFMPQVAHAYEYSKKEYPGPLGNFRFGRMIKRREKYDLFFCLPFSFSAALVGFLSGSKKRSGYKEEHRGFMLTNGYKRPPGLHEAEEHLYLIEKYFGKKVELTPYKFDLPARYKLSVSLPESKYIVLNVNSGAQSRTLPIQKAISLITAIHQNLPYKVVLIGAGGEADYVSEIEKGLPDNTPVINYAGKTNLIELAYIIKNASCMVSTDSGNGHLASALGTKLIVFFGAGNEIRTRPLNPDGLRILRKPDMPCAPCHPEICQFGDPKCLMEIENKWILQTIEDLVNSNDESLKNAI